MNMSLRFSKHLKAKQRSFTIKLVFQGRKSIKFWWTVLNWSHCFEKFLLKNSERPRTTKLSFQLANEGIKLAYILTASLKALSHRGLRWYIKPSTSSFLNNQWKQNFCNCGIKEFLDPLPPVKQLSAWKNH